MVEAVRARGQGQLRPRLQVVVVVRVRLESSARLTEVGAVLVLRP